VIDTYLEVLYRRDLEKTASVRVHAAFEKKAAAKSKLSTQDFIAQGGGALGPGASAEPDVPDMERVSLPSAASQQIKMAALLFADTMGRELAKSDFEKRASARFEKAAFGLGDAGKFLVKHPASIGAATGAVGGAVVGGPDHRISGALGGAAVGAGVGHAGVGIGKRMIQRGQGLGESMGNYGTEVRRKFNATVGKIDQVRDRQVPISQRAKFRAQQAENPNGPLKGTVVPGQGAGRAGLWRKPPGSPLGTIAPPPPPGS